MRALGKLILIALCCEMAQAWMASSTSAKDICSQYEKRLGLDFSLRQGEPCEQKLRILTESHLETIPFENLRLHGAANAPVSMDTPVIAHQLIDRQRGGLCFELNGLFGELLEQLGYDVTYIRASVIQSSAEVPHLGLLVTDCQGKTWFADVGMGEPPLHPLLLIMDEIQPTPDGMKSRFVQDGDLVTLEWYLPNERAWHPRLQFSCRDAEHRSGDLSPKDFEPMLLDVLGLETGGKFRRKAVACKLTRDMKTTLTGNKLKRSWNRFNSDARETVQELQTVDEVRQVLSDEFGIPLKETTGLVIPQTSFEGMAPNVW